jgi:methylated-DNA-[protein]-cysteine S-methyltransferase
MAVSFVRYRADGWGVGELWIEGDRLLQHELPRPAAKPPVRVSGPGEGERGNREVSPLDSTHPLARRLQEYFAGGTVSFSDVDLDLDWCSPFQRAVAHVLREVPRGEVVTYGELAALAGHPNAQRAAGSFCARNRFPIVVPCHRVVAADGLGSYGSLGTAYKRRLLELERATV